MATLAGVALGDPAHRLAWTIVLSLALGFAGATLDLVIDGWRITSVRPPEKQAVLSSWTEDRLAHRQSRSRRRRLVPGRSDWLARCLSLDGRADAAGHGRGYHRARAGVRQAPPPGPGRICRDGLVSNPGASDP